MKMKTQLKLAAVVAAGLLASGCSQQMVGQQVAQQVAPAAAAPTVKTVVDCSKCKRPAAPRGGNLHTHPAIPNCTKSVRHNHPHPQGGRHSHKYGCKKAAPRRAAPPRKAAPAPRPAPVQRVNPNAHTHPAIPNCTNSIRHVHPNGNRAHAHRYGCRKAAPRRQAPPRARVNPNLHTHPAIPGCTKSVRHQHPNGNRPHNHRYSCRKPQQQQRPQYQQVTPVMPKVKAKGTYRGPIKIDGVMQQYQN